MPVQSFQERLMAYKSKVLKETGEDEQTKPKQNDTNRSKKRPLKKGNTTKTSKKKKKRITHTDPSMEYISNPCGTPIVRLAKSFMQKDAKLNKPFQIILGPTSGWRTTAKLSVRGTNPIKIGLFAPGSHDVVPLLESKAHHPSINKAAKLLHQAALKLKIKGYDGKNAGGLSYVAFNVEITTGKIQLTCVFNSDQVEEHKQKVKQIANFINKQNDKILHSVWLHLHAASKHDNSIFGRQPNSWFCVYGEEKIQDVLNIPIAAPKDYDSKIIKPVLFFPPFVFRQANINAFGGIIRQARKFALPGTKLVELYGGVGTIGLHFLDKCKFLSCSDENPHNEACFNQAKSLLPESYSNIVEYTTASASTMANQQALESAKVVIVDPPRKGLDPEVIDAMLRSETVDRIIYVSCGFNAFTRDCMKLIENRYDIVHAEGHVLFPGANHLETLAIFDRKGANVPIPTLSEKPKRKMKKKTNKKL